MYNLTMGFEEIPLDFAIVDIEHNTILSCVLFSRSQTLVKAMLARLNSRPSSINGYEFTAAYSGIKSSLAFVANGRDRITVGIGVNEKLINSSYLITSEESVYTDLYNYLLSNCDFPLLYEWMPYIFDELQIVPGENASSALKICYEPVLTDNERKFIKINGKDIPVNKVMLLHLDITNDILKGVLSNGLANKHITLTKKRMKSLEFKNLDEYLDKYGTTIVDNLRKGMDSLVPVKGMVDTLALLTKRPYPQQSNCINGIVALLNKQRFAFVIEGMGCGKTMQGFSIVESYYVSKEKRIHPHKTLSDIYSDRNCINYRNIVMCPSHLVETWAREIQKDVPYAKVTVISKLSDIINVKNRGSKRRGKEWFIVSKDSVKLGSSIIPIPYKTSVTKDIKIKYCVDCWEKYKEMVEIKDGEKCCNKCGSRNFMKAIKPRPEEAELKAGLLCPYCGEVIIRNGDKGDIKILGPLDFSNPSASNRKCYHCGNVLWGAEAKLLDNGKGRKKKHKAAWKKITHYANHTKKTKRSAYIMNGFKEEYIASNGITEDEVVNDNRSVESSRSYAICDYIKKYMKGYFDFGLFDEAHLYEKQSAQGHAMHVINSVCKKVIAMTGTIANGYATNLFYLFYYVAPKMMQAKGFSFADVGKFAKCYGTVETIYSNDSDDVFNTRSKGKLIQPAKQSPGISPNLYVDFLLENCVQLDISDMGNYLPKLNEEIVTVCMDDEIKGPYHYIIDELKGLSKSGEGRGVLAQMLRFGLYYPDKPFGHENIKSGFVKDQVLVTVDSIDKFRNELTEKEKKLVEIVNKEVSEHRNMFIFLECTGNSTYYLPERIKKIVENECGLVGKVAIMQSNTPAAKQREKWIHSKAEKDGIKCFICNMKTVETGLDFVWKDKRGKVFNFPTIIAYQMTYNLSSLWQASRRAYRLIQREECRNYYFAYKNTLQEEALLLMGKKIQAVSSIQGKFTASGLAQLSRGVDARLALAQKLSKMDDRSDADMDNVLKNTFGELNKLNNMHDDTFDNADVTPLFKEVVGEEYTSNLFDDYFSSELFSLFKDSSKKKVDKKAVIEEVSDGNEIVDETKHEINSDTSVTDVVNSNKILQYSDKIPIDSTKKEINISSLFDLLDDTEFFDNDIDEKVVKSKKTTVDKTMSLFDLLSNE